MKWLSQRFPHLRRQLLDLAKQHLEIADQPLHLAIAYDPGRDSQDIFLFELLDNFGGNEINPDAQLFEATFGSSKGFSLEPDQRLHFILTNPEEFRAQHSSNTGQRPRKFETRCARVIRDPPFGEIGRDALEFLNEGASSMAVTGS